jgi:hypothetical protein
MSQTFDTTAATTLRPPRCEHETWHAAWLALYHYLSRPEFTYPGR